MKKTYQKKNAELLTSKVSAKIIETLAKIKVECLFLFKKTKIKAPVSYNVFSM